jgi:hypothetical protein
MSEVRSRDATTIAYERTGSGPALVLVDGALCSRSFGPSAKLAARLAPHFSVYSYDRRGRGQSGDTPPYSPAREVEDIAALVEAAGGSAALLGLSSGAALALEAAAAGVPVERVAAYEPPYVDDAGESGGAGHEGRLKSLLASGDRGGAVKYFMRDMVGEPAFVLVMVRLMPWVWRQLEAVASSQGVRLRFSAGSRTVREGPFEPGNELPAGFSILRARSLDEAIEWASRQAEALGDVEVDIRPVTEPWDIGMAPRPADVATRRFMVLRKATAATEVGVAPDPAQRAELSRLVEQTPAGVHLATETMRPSARGRRYKNSRDGVTMVDGPFAETKELIGGYVVVSADSIDDAHRWAMRYIEAVEGEEVDVRELD